MLGHQIVGVVDGEHRRVGVPWLGWTCGECAYCTSGRENLCERARFTGRDIDGGFAEYAVADERFCLPIPDGYPDLQAAPLLCAGLIGYRALRMCGDASASACTASAPRPTSSARSPSGRGGACSRSPVPATSGAGARPRARRRVGGRLGGRAARAARRRHHLRPGGRARPGRAARARPGGTVVCAGIHMSDIPSFPYELLWGERSVRSVANLTRADGASSSSSPRACRSARMSRLIPLARAGEALEDLRGGRVVGAAVVEP